MTVVIDIDKNNNKRYSSNLNKSKFSTEDEFRLADELNELIKNKIEKYIEKVGLQLIKKDRVLYYWEIGNIIRDIFFKSGLVLSDEKDLFFKNVRLHLNSDIFPGDDSSRHRNIPEQFFRLAGYRKEVIEKVKWTIWSYLFDSPILSRIKNFDVWFNQSLEKSSLNFDQAFSRLWFQAINVLFKNVSTEDWENDTILNLIDSLFALCLKIINSGYKPAEKKTMELLKKTIAAKRKEFILLKSGLIKREVYLEIMFDAFKEAYNKE
jgi:hypothetical protein